MKLRTLKLMLSWILLGIAAFGVATVLMQRPWQLLLVTIITFVIVWAIMAIVEWREWRQITRSHE